MNNILVLYLYHILYKVSINVIIFFCDLKKYKKTALQFVTKYVAYARQLHLELKSTQKERNQCMYIRERQMSYLNIV